jgi:hypothetical protein
MGGEGTGLPMALHLTYIELAWFFGILSALRLLFQFAIKMIAIFARDEFSARAFKVLKLGRREHHAAISHSRMSDEPRTPPRRLRREAHHKP